MKKPVFSEAWWVSLRSTHPTNFLSMFSANGTNILAIAYAFPQVQCFGIDSSIRQIEQGQASAIKFAQCHPAT
ncbi:MAG: hypothetical protein VSS75_021085 [Candidatus Parabeggiatoa sp.]|nr:hypothetical protein [Candidatus Parabeggiatoa sp.]